tara:strand:- start:3733 stop:4143 length:411 start_codon:yes stop_codon:yes gene_type:complete
VLIQEKTLPAISVAVGAASEVVTCNESSRATRGAGANGLTGVAVDDLDNTAKIREMYRTVRGDGIGELDAATRRTCGLGDEPAGGVSCHGSGAGERAKLGIRNAFMGLDRGGVVAVGPSGEAILASTVPLMAVGEP